MASAKRNILVFQSPNLSTDFYSLLLPSDWEIHRVGYAEEALTLIAKNKFLVGLSILDESRDDLFVEQMVKLFDKTPKIHWLMVLAKERLAQSSIYSKECKLISDYCFDYLTSPVDAERLNFAVGHAYGMAELSNSPYRDFTQFPNFDGIIGYSRVMRNLYKQIQKVCKEDFSVLIEGETGTGKELVANAIHRYSSRGAKPLVALNCGAFPPDLIQAELFGYEKGAFTGANARKIGRIESAQGGTLFLDEVGDLPLAQQVNLLRFLEERCIERVGGRDKIPVDLRIISATHIDLKQAVLAGKFREDLYYRLKVLQLKTPPLRERESDIELLIWYFFGEFSKGNKHRPRGFNADALRLLQHYEWPGNVRELMNCIRHAVIMSENNLLTPNDLGLDKRARERNIRTLEEVRDEAERGAILAAIHRARFNMSRAAQSLGISRVSLYRLLNKHKIETRENSE